MTHPQLSPIEQLILENVTTGRATDCRSPEGKKGKLRSAFLEEILRESFPGMTARPRGLKLAGALIEGLDLSASDVRTRIEIEESTFSGVLNLNGAHLRSLVLRDCVIPAIDAEWVEVDESVELIDGFTSAGEVNLQGARIRGQLVCQGGTFGDPGSETAYALTLDGARIQSDVFLDDGFHARGETRLVGAWIGGDLYAENGSFINHGGDAVFGDRLEVSGSLHFRRGAAVVGGLSLRWAQVGRYADFSDATLTAEVEGSGIDLTGLRTPWLTWKRVGVSPRTRVRLNQAEVVTLEDDDQSWPGEGLVSLKGFRYAHLSADSPLDAATRIDWLARDDFDFSSYRHLQKLYSTSGRNTEAVTVGLAAERRRGRGMGSTRRFIHWLWGVIAGYGYKPQRSAGALLLLILVGALAFSPDHMERSDSGSRVSYNQWAYSADTVLPIIDLGIADHWLPGEPWRQTVRWVSIALGWGLALALGAAASKALARSPDS